MEKTKLAVIGAGPGGYAAAFYGADMGLDVTLIDKYSALGGVCLNWGCIPSKFLLHISRLISEAKDSEEMGIRFGKPEVHLETLRNYKNKVIQNMNQGLSGLAKNRKIKVLQGKASFLDPHRLVIESEEKREELEFEWAIVATGSRPFVLPLFQLSSEKIMTSDSALDLKEIPKSLLVVGGGVIGLELGSVYSALGSKVTMVEILPEIAAGADPDLIKILKDPLKKRMENIYTSTKVTQIKEKKNSLEVTFDENGKIFSEEFSACLVSTGRIPNTENLGLEKAGVSLTEKNFISVQSSFQTSKPHIFAIGDVVGNPMLAHKASSEARVAVDKILGKHAVWDHRGIPSVIYTDPEVAWVGLTEEEARKKKIPCAVGKFPWQASGRAQSVGRTEGLTKILFDPETERVLGVGMVGVGAGELIAEGCLALEMGAVMEDIANTIHAHPTLSETFLESAEDLHGLSTHIYRPRGKKS